MKLFCGLLAPLLAGGQGKKIKYNTTRGGERVWPNCGMNHPLWCIWTSGLIQEALNLWTNALSSINTEKVKKYRGTKYSLKIFPNVERPTHHGPGQRGILYSLWTCPTTEHPAYLGPTPPQKILLTMDLPHCGTPYSTCESPRTTLLTVDLLHCRIHYSSCNWLTWETLLTQTKKTLKIIERQWTIKDNTKHTDITPIDWIGLRADSVKSQCINWVYKEMGNITF